MSLIWGGALHVAKKDSIGGKAESLRKLESLGYKGAAFAVLTTERIDKILSEVKTEIATLCNALVQNQRSAEATSIGPNCCR